MQEHEDDTIRTRSERAATLRRLRLERGWSMGELARRAGVDAGTVSRLESGRVPRPNLTTSVALARALGVHPAGRAHTPDAEAAP